jgi:hypothetical protein
MKSNWLRIVLILLIIEKVIQHIFVTVAFFFDFKDIASTVAVNPAILMITGALIGTLFIVSLWGMLTDKSWAINLVIGLALFDIVGEFVAQGKIYIVCTVSFLAAILLLILSLIYKKREYTPATA